MGRGSDRFLYEDEARPQLPGWITRHLGYTEGIAFDAEGNLWVTLPAAHMIVPSHPLANGLSSRTTRRAS